MSKKIDFIPELIKFNKRHQDYFREFYEILNKKHYSTACSVIHEFNKYFKSLSVMLKKVFSQLQSKLKQKVPVIEGSLFQTCCESVKRRVAKDIPWNCSQNNQVGFLFVVSNYSIFHISVNPERKTNPGKLCWGTEGLSIEFTISMRLIKQFSTCPCCSYELGSVSVSSAHRKIPQSPGIPLHPSSCK